MVVPLLDLKQQNLALETQLMSTFERILHSGVYILGEEVTKFEHAIAHYLGVKHAIGVSSGTDAILLALMALGIGPGDEVLCPTYTFFATAGCVSRLGAIPVWVDSSDEDFNLDIEDAAKKITSRTKAIIPVHLFGQSADMDTVLQLAKKHNLFVLEDAAQSLSATYKNSQSGTLGHFGAYSFFPSKNLGALGDAGLLVTNDDALAEKAFILRVHGSKPKYFHKFIGGNFRIDALQAALLHDKLPHLETYSNNRTRNAQFYLKKLIALSGVGYRKDNPSKIILPEALPNRKHIWNQFTLRVLGSGKRDAFKSHFYNKGIGCEIYYPLCLDAQECFEGKSHGADFIQVAHQLSQEAISIPIFPELRQEQLEYVVQAIEEFIVNN